MSGPSGGFLRLRLFFDYPPPSTPESCQCWLLLDLSRCRVVTDLSSLIRSKFGFSHGARLSLYLQDCLLPPCEGIGLVRDNDCIRVKLDEVGTLRDVDEDGYSVIHSPNKAIKRPMLEPENEEEPPQIKKKKKHHFEMSPSNKLHSKARKVKKKSKQWKTKPDNIKDSSPEVKGIDQKKKQKKKKKQKNKEIEFENIGINNCTSTKRNKALDAKVISAKVYISSKGQPEKRKEARKVSESDSSSTSSLSSNDKSKQSASKSPVSLKKNNAYQLVSGVATTVTTVENPDAPVVEFHIKSVPEKTVASTSNSDSDTSKERTCRTMDNGHSPTKNDSPQNNIPSQPVKKIVKSTSESSDSSDSDSFVIRKPNPGHLTGGNQISVGDGDKKSFAVLYGPAPNPKWAEGGMGRGFGRGENVFPWRGPRGRGVRGRIRGRGRGDNRVAFDYSSNSQKQQQLNHTVSNRSIIIQNPPEKPRDYSSLPLLAAAPPVGQMIAFKLLELTDNYTPEVSEYKEGKIISYSPASKQLDLEVFSTSRVAKEPGKFDLVYEGAGGKHKIEYAISQDTKMTQSWSALIEPRLIIETCSIPAISENKENGENVPLPQ